MDTAKPQTIPVTESVETMMQIDRYPFCGDISKRVVKFSRTCVIG
jgi:hypothetical protein